MELIPGLLTRLQIRALGGGSTGGNKVNISLFFLSQTSRGGRGGDSSNSIYCSSGIIKGTALPDNTIEFIECDNIDDGSAL